jgi:hypothetical protein
MSVATRIYRDYLQRERLDELRALMARAVELGYEPMTLSAFAERDGAADRVLLLRHDVDSDVARARRIWEIERELGVVGSYFFRRSTWDVAFMHELSAGGCEVGYHYEELATLIKRRGARSPAEARALIEPARDALRASLAELRAHSRLALDVLASHGDFANRALDVANVELLKDAQFRAAIGVRLEAYDVEDRVDVRCFDAGPDGWKPVDPARALARGAPVVELLLHPRAWGAAPVINARLDVERAVDGALYRMRRRRRLAAVIAGRCRARTAGRRSSGSARPTDPSRPTRRPG